MGTGISSHNEDLILLTALHRAMIRRQIALKYQMSKISFRSNFIRTFTVSNNGQEPVFVSKAIARKIAEIRKMKAIFKFGKRRPRQVNYFLNILTQMPSENLLVYIQSHRDHFSLVNEETHNFLLAKERLEKLIMKKQDLQNILNSISAKVSIFEIESIKLSKLKAEIKDLRFYKSHLVCSKQYLKSKRDLKPSEKNEISNEDSTTFSNKLYLLKQSRALAENYKEKLLVLQNKVNEKYDLIFSKNEDIVKELKSGDYIFENQKEKKLESLLRREEAVKEKLGYWNKQLEDIKLILVAKENEFSKEYNEKWQMIKSRDRSNTLGRIQELNKEWDNYNSKYRVSMKIFNSLISRKLQV